MEMKIDHKGTRVTSKEDSDAQFNHIELSSECRKEKDVSENFLSKVRALGFVRGEGISFLSPTGRDEGFEDSPVALASGRENFGMPLHADDKSVARAFDSFDHAVIGDGIDDQAFAELLDRLVMRRVDL